jgi:hypothetical protein
MTDHTRRTCSAARELEDCQTTGRTSSIIGIDIIYARRNRLEGEFDADTSTFNSRQELLRNTTHIAL